MSYRKSPGRGNTEYTISYTDLRGVDLSGDGCDISRHRLSYAENLFRDYGADGSGALESIPGYRRIASLDQRLHGIYGRRRANGEEEAVFHAGDSLYRLKLSERDTATPTLIAEVADRKSAAFTFGDRLYLLDGTQLLCLRDAGCATVGTGSGQLAPYVPTVYLNGAPYEQRNLLTDAAREEYRIGAAVTYAACSEGLCFRITSGAEATCAVTGVTDPCPTILHIPSRVKLGDVYYQVTSIDNYAFQNRTELLTVYATDGLQTVGSFAFSGCSALSSVLLPDTVREIGNAAFNNCAALSYLRFGVGMQRIGSAAASFCTSLSTLQYGGSEAEYAAIEGTEVFGSSTTVTYHVSYREISIDLPLAAPVASVQSVTVNGTGQSFSMVYGERGPRLRLSFSDRAQADGASVIIHQTLRRSDSGGFLSLYPPAQGEGDPIRACRVCECFDGRVFLAGNPLYPNTVFYTGRTASGDIDPLYFGAYNYFNDGVGQDAVTALLAAGDRLAVFKSGDDGTGSIFYHKPADSQEALVPRIYPVAYVHSGTLARGEALSFLDDPVFLSEGGLCALDRTDISAERSIAVRSHNVNPALLTETLSEATLTCFEGYLVVCAGSRWYLADSRATFLHPTGGVEYEWYCLSGIGTYRNATRVYRYASEAPPGYCLHTPADEEVTDTVYSEGSEEDMRYYTREGDMRCAVYPTEELRGGSFSPAVLARAVAGLLFFGTENGDVCLFNTDRRGLPPPGHEEDPAFTSGEYRRLMGRRLHPAYYSFDGHAPRYAMKTRMDNGDIPHLAKDSVRHSLTVKCRATPAGQLTAEIATDRAGYRELCAMGTSHFSFSDLDFGSLALLCTDSFTLVLNEREKNWVEKQIALYSEGYASPISVLSLHYRFRIRGDIRRR